MADDLEALDQMIEIARAGRVRGKDIWSLLEKLYNRANELEVTYLDQASRRLQKLYGEAMLSLLGLNGDLAQPVERANAEVLLLLSQFMKGMRYGTIFTSGAGSAHKSDEQEIELFAEMRRSFDVSGSVGRLSEYLLVTPVTIEGVEVDICKVKGEDDPKLTPGRQHAYSIYVAHALAREAANRSTFLNALTLPSALDKDTVLIDLCVVEKFGPSALIASIWTREEVRIAVRPLPPLTHPNRFSADGVDIYTSVVANAVREIRTAINLDPGESELADSARPVLNQVSELLVGFLGEHLADLKAQTKRHLCIVPHGPLHFVPFHLLQIDGRHLADDWVVTSLPNVRLLLGRITGYKKRVRKEQASFGLSYRRTNPFRLPPLDEAVAESLVIAQLGNGIPCLEDNATRGALVRALAQCRFVHVAAHSKQNAIGPVLHALYLSPENSDDGRLFAHELLGNDLGGLELVTLSACETALGRFDIGDNLSGFPAMLLMCGAECVIGTLWEVETNAAVSFFTTLYDELVHGLRPKDAFAAAQRITRVRHPQYRDWGAFHYMGDWM
jgi:CHAT domain-containing protein